MAETFAFTFDMKISDNPSLKHRNSNLFFDNVSIGKVGEMAFAKFGTTIIATFFFDDFEKDVVIFDISKFIGKDIHFSFNFEEGKVAQVFVFSGTNPENIKESNFARCPT